MRKPETNVEPREFSDFQLIVAKVLPAVAATSLPADAVEGAAAGVVFDGFPGVNAAFLDGMHAGLWVAAAFCAVIAATVLIAVREAQHHDVDTVLEEAAEAVAGHR
ncbi:hypothetical protein L1277_001880 [Okibacterium sp. HSC-33S16]|uniref:hypothetical protein n=1 Tax=Okibacterium sp. HSC-33S16 TaxID=2910965 RepID=UPI00209CB3AF|nr:hypothetical protein [Okibacterium sp. HSC-33S16]MCP2031782.1 hypothetical protein [Okibacterium sp. HSC-33S16]